MKPFDYVRPEKLDDVCGLLEEHGAGALLLAGGTDVIVRLRAGRKPPRFVIDLKRVTDLRADIADFGTYIRIGARATMSDLTGDEHIRRHFPALVEAAGVVGSIQIRNRATLAGNICNASPAADTAPVLLAHHAVVNLIGLRSARSVPLTGFFTGPGRTVMSSAEMVESIDLPIAQEPCGAAFGRITRRYGVDLATVSVCCLVTKQGETRFAYGAVAPTPILMTGDCPCASPISDVRGSREYREAMLLVMSRRLLAIARGRLP